MVIPAEFRRQLGLQPGTEVTLDIADGDLRIRSVRQVIETAQSLVRQYVGRDIKLADELIDERRDEARLD